MRATRRRPVALTVVAGAIVAVGASCALTACGLGQQQTADDATMRQVEQLRDQTLRDSAAHYGLDDTGPLPPLVRYVTPEESPAVLQQCLHDEGFDVAVLADGGIDFSGLPESQREKGGPVVLALWTCSAKYTIDPRTQQLLTQEQYHVLYDYYTGSLTSCIQSRGITVGEAPSFTTFVDTYNDEPWTPYDSVIQGDLASGEWDAIITDCPQGPPSSLLYGPPLQQPEG
jgi:hypothetical protein